MFNGEIEQRAAQAERLRRTLVPEATCVAQEWDERVDCLLKLKDGTVIGEMVALEELTESRIRATGERLRQRAEGSDVQLVNELRPPNRIIPRREV